MQTTHSESDALC